MTKTVEFNSKRAEINRNIHYFGLFVNFYELNSKLKHIDRIGLKDKKEIKYPHVTLKYKPDFDEIPVEFFGSSFTLIIDGYGYDEENEGVHVLFKCDNPVIQEWFDKIENPHITLSVSENGKVVNTKYLVFKPIDEIYITCILGGFIKNEYKT